MTQAQFAGEPILQGVPAPLDAAFGLGGAGLEIADAEVREHAAEVRGGLGPLEWFGEAPVGVIADEYVDAIAVDAGPRPSIQAQGLPSTWTICPRRAAAGGPIRG